MYELYKKRERVEKLFDAYKNVLDADRLYLQDDESVCGHVFISFLSLSRQSFGWNPPARISHPSQVKTDLGQK